MMVCAKIKRACDGRSDNDNGIADAHGEDDDDDDGATANDDVRRDDVDDADEGNHCRNSTSAADDDADVDVVDHDSASEDGDDRFEAATKKVLLFPIVITLLVTSATRLRRPLLVFAHMQTSRYG